MKQKDYDLIEVDKYTVLKLEDGGKYGFKVIEGYTDNAGEFRPSFCKRRFGGKNAEEKTAPLAIKLGDRETAAAVLQGLLWQVTGDGKEPF